MEKITKQWISKHSDYSGYLTVYNWPVSLIGNFLFYLVFRILFGIFYLVFRIQLTLFYK